MTKVRYQAPIFLAMKLKNYMNSWETIKGKIKLFIILGRQVMINIVK